MSILDVQGTRLTSLDDGLGGRAPVAGVNLMPPEILAGRVFRRTQQGLAAAALAVVAAVAGVYVTTANVAAAAADELTVVQATGATLTAEQARYAEVPRMAKAIDDAETARATAMADDVDWSRYLTSFSLTLPERVWFTSLDLKLASAGGTTGTSAATGATAGTAGTAAAPRSGGIAGLTVTGVAATVPDVAAWLDTLGAQRAVTDPFVTTAEKKPLGEREVVEFTSVGTVGAAALTHRFDRKAG